MANSRREGGKQHPVVSPSTFRRLAKRSGAEVVLVVFVRQGEDGQWSAEAEAGHRGEAPAEAFEAAIEALRVLAGQPSVLAQVGTRMLQEGISLGADFIRRRYTQGG